MVVRAGRAGYHVVLPWGRDLAPARHRRARGCDIRRHRRARRGLSANARRSWSGLRATATGHRSVLPDREQSPQYRVSRSSASWAAGPMSVVYLALAARPEASCGIEDRPERPGLGLARARPLAARGASLSCVRHPNVVPLHEAGEAGLALSRPRVHSGTERSSIGWTSPMPPGTPPRLLEMIARAVAAIHGRRPAPSRPQAVKHPARRRPGKAPGGGDSPGRRFRHRPPLRPRSPASPRTACQARWEHPPTCRRSR